MTTIRQTIHNTIKLVVLVMLILSLAIPASSVFADDTPPPAETLEVVDAPVEETEPVGENPVEEAEPGDEAPAEEQPAGEEPQGGSDVVEPYSGESEPSEVSPAEEETVILSQLPEGTDLVVLDEQGEAVPLVTTQAAAIMTVPDPQFCPSGALPGELSCSPVRLTIQEAIDDARAAAVDGTVYIQSGTYNEIVTIADFTNALTVRGVSSLSPYAELSEPTDRPVINGRVLLVDGNDNEPGTDFANRGNIILMDLIINNYETTNGDDSAIYANRNTGDLTLVNVDINSPDSGNSGLVVENHFGDVTLTNVSTSGAANRGADIDNTAGSGSVTVNGSTFNQNNSDGLWIRTNGAITLNNVTADGSLTGSGALLDNNESGADANSTVTVTGTNSFSGNQDFGLRIVSQSSASLENITADNNSTEDGAHIDIDAGPGSVTINGTNSFSQNGNDTNDDGLYVRSQGSVILNNILADSNWNDGVDLSNATGGISNVTLTGVNVFTNNGANGLLVSSDGIVSLNEITADWNGTGASHNGVQIDNDNGTGNVEITGYHNSFSNNTGPGLNISTEGDILLEFATIVGNSSTGATFNTPGANNSRSARIYCSIFGNNNGYGLNAWTFENSLTFVGLNQFFSNPSGDYRFNGVAGFEAPDTLCAEPVYGCTDPEAFNYDPEANVDDESCVPVILGCTDPSAFNYNPEANVDDESCVPVVLGCTDQAAFNYNPEANVDDESCTPVVLGCTDPADLNYNASANVDDGSCVSIVLGCTDPAAYNYNSAATVDDESCVPAVLGCTDPSALNYTPDANVDDGSCTPAVLGCTDINSLNFNSDANVDDGSCVPVVLGCTDPAALNYNASANVNDESCVPVILGCTDPTMEGYDPLANVNDGSCRVPEGTAGSGASVVIPVTGGQQRAISCVLSMTEMMLADGDFVTFGNLCGYDAMLENVQIADLPGLLPNTVQYISGLSVALLQNSLVVEPLPAGASMTVAFKVPSGLVNETFGILRWDGGKWVEEIVTVEGGYVKTTSNHTGVFVLVQK